METWFILIDLNRTNEVFFDYFIIQKSSENGTTTNIVRSPITCLTI